MAVLARPLLTHWPKRFESDNRDAFPPVPVPYRRVELFNQTSVARAKLSRQTARKLQNIVLIIESAR
jgi:hypothetical protein